MQNKFARTDLAAEAVGRLDKAPEGVCADTLSLHGCEVSRVVITSEAGAEALGKPIGKYLTLEMADYVTRAVRVFPTARRRCAICSKASKLLSARRAS